MQAQQGPVHAVALAQTADGCLAYCIGHTGTLKIFNAKAGTQVWPLHMFMRREPLQADWLVQERRCSVAVTRF